MKALFVAGAVALLAATVPTTTPLALPGGEGGIGFDDMGFAASLHRVLVPSGRTGRLNLVDPTTRSVESVDGFSSQGAFAGGHGEGTTSADAGRGFVFASDRSRKAVQIVDPAKKQLVGAVALGGGPDYVRWVEPRSELWVTEPGRNVIEYFTLAGGPSPKLVRGGTIPIADGPESLVIDATRGRAYTHTWHDETIAIDLKAHNEVARWPNGCEGARGIALDETRGLLFVGCDEGKATSLDVAHDGKRLGMIETGKGVDIIAYSAGLRHLYVPGGDSATMTIVAVGPGGGLRALSTVPTAADAHCVAADDLGNAYVCDPSRGRLLVVADTFAAEKP